MIKTIELTVFMEILLVVKMTRQQKQREASKQTQDPPALRRSQRTKLFF